MSGLLGGLINASKSLAAQEAGAQTAGRNLANVNNPNYARQRVILGDYVSLDTPMGPLGDGVQVQGVEQIRDSLLDANVAQEIAQSSSLTAQQSALGRAESNLGESINSAADSSSISDNSHSTNGVSSSLNDFFNGWEELSSRPADTSARQLLLQDASTLSDKLNTTDARLASLQTDLTTQINSDVGSANSVLQSVADLNKQIAAVEVSKPGSAIDLRDQRQAKLEELAKYTDFTSREVPGSNGQIEIVSHDASNAEVTLVSKNVVHPLSFSGSTFSVGTPPTALVVKGGSLAGNLTARDGAVQQLRDQLGALAKQLTTSVNAAYNPGGAGQNFFQAAPATGLLQVNAALTTTNLVTSTSSDSGANDIALAVGALATQKFSTGAGDLIDGSPSGFLANSVSGLGGTLRAVNSKLADQQIVQTMVTNQRDSVSGVSMDEELASLMSYQRAYQASSKVVSTLDQMLSDLINTVRQ